MSRRRKNPHPQRAVNAKTVLKATEKEEEPLLMCSRRIPDEEDVEANRQKGKKTNKKGEKFKIRERSVALFGERETSQG